MVPISSPIINYTVKLSINTHSSEINKSGSKVRKSCIQGPAPPLSSYVILDKLCKLLNFSFHVDKCSNYQNLYLWGLLQRQMTMVSNVQSIVADDAFHKHDCSRIPGWQQWSWYYSVSVNIIMFLSVTNTCVYGAPQHLHSRLFLCPPPSHMFLANSCYYIQNESYI